MGGSPGPDESAISGIRPVDLPQIPSGHRRRFRIVILQPVDVDAVLANLDSLHEDVDSVVIAGRGKVGEVDGAGSATVAFQKNFDESSAGRRPADFPTQLIGEWIMDQRRIELVGGV